MLSKLLPFICIFFSTALAAQPGIGEGLYSAKFSPLANQQITEPSFGSVLCYLVVKDLPTLRTKLRQRGVAPAAILREYPRWNGALVYLDYADLRDWVSAEDNITFVDIRDKTPQPERAIRDLDLSANGLNLVHYLLPEIDGSGQVVSIKENAFDSTDIDISSRYLPSALRDGFVTTHATTMATLVGGAGNSYYTGKGAAPGSMLSSISFDNLFPDPENYFDDNRIAIQNHSYGVGIENYYGGEAMAYDEQAYRRTDLTHVFSAGNQGDQLATTGTYQGIPGFANLTGNMKMAKNLLTVGSVNSALEVSVDNQQASVQPFPCTCVRAPKSAPESNRYSTGTR